ncbi:lachesin-like [Macrobrachium rosenbergii]|uniref:lachesin-like n=1 Tax=Macrobrachium rosenbergii TaxID=79674 RepID=UPI0034D6FFC2
MSMLQLLVNRWRPFWLFLFLGLFLSVGGSSSIKRRSNQTASGSDSQNSYSLRGHHHSFSSQFSGPSHASFSHSGHSLQSSVLLQAEMGPSTLQGVGPPTLEIPASVLSRRRSFTEEEAAMNPPEGPYFVIPQITEITTRAGQAATLTCIVKQLGDKQVSWIRGRDLHVLSSGQVAFSSDSRVSVAHVGDSWTLTIKYTQPRDAGQYSCQVNTQPRIATWYNLTVIEARANIQGKETLYVQSGSTVTLECVIKEELVIPGLVLWYQDDRLVERESGRVKVVTKVANVTTSTLTVAVAEDRDSGNYSCWPSAGRPDSVMVHVIQGDPPAAMQHGNSASGFSNFLLIPTNIISLLFLFT